MNTLAYWINERYSILQRRRAGQPAPWSSDPIFQTVRFCNVHREDDRVTQWIRTNWNRADDPAWKFVLGRMINLPESLDHIKECDDPDSQLRNMRDILGLHRSGGHKVFTSAYTISTCGKRMDKLDYVFELVQAVQNMKEPTHIDCRTVWQDLQKVDGLGSFLAAQVVADMKNTKGHPLWHADDWWTFHAPGPGSLRGLSWYFMNEPRGVTVGSYEHYFDKCRAEVDPLIDEEVPRISNQDFQSCLCEFSKYTKVKQLNGHVRNRYAPHNHS